MIWPVVLCSGSPSLPPHWRRETINKLIWSSYLLFSAVPLCILLNYLNTIFVCPATQRPETYLLPNLARQGAGRAGAAHCTLPARPAARQCKQSALSMLSEHQWALAALSPMGGRGWWGEHSQWGEGPGRGSPGQREGGRSSPGCRGQVFTWVACWRLPIKPPKHNTAAQLSGLFNIFRRKALENREYIILVMVWHHCLVSKVTHN